jgi:hypothetical protein
MFASETWRNWSLNAHQLLHHLTQSSVCEPSRMGSRWCIYKILACFHTIWKLNGKTHGGRKNCSNTTYIPRAISVKRKYLPALSNEDSLLSSHLSGFGNRKPGGGGPEGVAYARRVLVENAARELEGDASGRTALENLAAGRLRVTSMVKGFGDVIMWLLVARWSKRGGIEVWKSRSRCRAWTNASKMIGW